MISQTTHPVLNFPEADATRARRLNYVKSSLLDLAFNTFPCPGQQPATTYLSLDFGERLTELPELHVAVGVEAEKAVEELEAIRTRVLHQT